jgi:hypothetical protein
MISKTEKFGDTFYQHPVQKANIGPSSVKILDGEDLSTHLSNHSLWKQEEDQPDADEELARSAGCGEDHEQAV